MLYLQTGGKKLYLSQDVLPTIIVIIFLKTLERVVGWHLACMPENSLSTFPTQFVYKEGASTEAALHSLVRQLESNVFSKRSALALFLDIEGAFSNMAFPSIELVLRERERDRTAGLQMDPIYAQEPTCDRVAWRH